MAAHRCMRCGSQLGADDIALFRKLIFREATSYLCMDCMADDFDVPRKKLEDIAAFYHRTGICCLFPRYDTQSGR